MKLDIKSLAINKKYINENYSQSGSYVHPDTPGNKHIPAGGIDGQVLKNNGLNGEAMWDDITPDNIGALSIDGDVAENTVTFDSQDSESVVSWIESATMKSGEKFHQLIAKISIMSNNLRFLRKMLGSTDISKIGDGTVTGILNSLNAGIADKMFTVGTSKPVSGYAVNQDSYILRSQFGHVDLYLNVDAQTIQNTWNIIGYIPEGYRPPEYIRLVAYISDGSSELTPVHCFAYSNGDIKVYNPLPTGNYYLLIWGSYLIVR